LFVAGEARHKQHSSLIISGAGKMQDLIDRLKENAAKIHDLLEHL
jgi:hypothetical protein